MIGGEGLHPIEAQAGGSRAARRGAGEHFFINARTDIFLATRRGHARRGDGRRGDRARACLCRGRRERFLRAGLGDLALLERLCAASPLPVNFMAFPGGPTHATPPTAGVARISYGPRPYRAAMRR